MFSFNKNTLLISFGKALWARFAFLALFASLSAIILSASFSSQANAAALSFPADTDTKIQKLLLHRFLGACIQNVGLSGGLFIDNGKRIEGNAKANAGDWFQGGVPPTRFTSSPYFEDDRFSTWKGSSNGYSRNSGVSDCGDEAIMKLALKAIGGSNKSGVDFLCDIGLVRSNGSPCKEGTGDFRYADNSGGGSTPYNAFRKAYPEPSLDDNGWYWFYRKVFNWTCGYGQMSTPVSEATAKGSSDFGYALTYITNEAPNYKKTEYFIGAENKNTTIGTRLVEGGSKNPVNRTCNEIANHINDYGNKEAARLSSLSQEDLEDLTNQPVAGEPTGDSQTSISSCRVDGIGWIVCPVMNFTAGIVDAAYGFVSDLLKVKPLMSTNSNDGVYGGWSAMRNVANIVFVIVFIFIIFSQLTGLGVSNYGVKKMLPRLVIAAILVNLSFWVCAIAVDISNILGSSMIDAFKAVGASIPGQEAVDTDGSRQTWQNFSGAVLAGGAAAIGVYWIGLSALIPALIAAFVAIITVFLVLTLRQALIILLIVIAPVAFVAYILPNTEDWFTKWRKLLMTLLLMYPIIAAIFGASALASAIVMNSSNDTVVQIMGAAIAIIPLAITPLVMKTAGGVLNRFAGIVNNAERGPFDRLKKAGEGYRSDRNNLRNARALNGQPQLGRGSFVKWRARRNSTVAGRQSEANRAGSEYVAQEIQGNTRFQNAVAGGTLLTAASSEAQQRALASAISTSDKLKADEVSAANVVIKNAQLNQAELREVSNGGAVTKNGINLSGSSTAVRAAAIENVVKSNDVYQINKIWNDSINWHDEKGNELRSVFADSLASSSARPAYIGQGAIAALKSSTEKEPHAQMYKIVETAIANNTYSPEKIVLADKDELAAVDVVRDTSAELTIEHKNRFTDNARKVLSDDRLKVRMGKNTENITKISKGFGDERAPEDRIDPLV